MLDIQILPKITQQNVTPQIIEVTSDAQYLLYQKIFILFLSKNSQLFRQGCGSSLLSGLEKCASYNKSLVQSIATAAKSEVKDMLTTQDLTLLDDIQISVDVDAIHIKVTTNSGSTYSGDIDVD